MAVVVLGLDKEVSLSPTKKTGGRAGWQSEGPEEVMAEVSQPLTVVG